MKVTNDPAERVYPYAQRRMFFDQDREATVWIRPEWDPGSTWWLYWSRATRVLEVCVLEEFRPRHDIGWDLNTRAGEHSQWRTVSTYTLEPDNIDAQIEKILRDRFRVVSMSTPTGFGS